MSKKQYCSGGCGRIIGVRGITLGDIKMEPGLMSMALKDKDYSKCNYCKGGKPNDVGRPSLKDWHTKKVIDEDWDKLSDEEKIRTSKVVE